MVELCCHSNFSLLRGASHPEEFVERAAALGVRHLGFTDRDAVYGLPRAHKAAKAIGVHLICGVSLTVGSVEQGFPPLQLLVESREGWRNVCRLLTKARAAAEKGRATSSISDIAEHAAGCTALFDAAWAPAEVSRLREAFSGRCGVLLVRHDRAAEHRWEARARALAVALDAPLVAAHQPLYHESSRRRVADVLTAIRRGSTLDALGRALEAHAGRALLSPEALRERFSDFSEAVHEAMVISERCTFSLDEVQYGYPREVVPEGHTSIGWLAELVERGLGERYPGGVPDRVRAQVAHEMAVIADLNFPSYFLTVHDVVRFARGRGILCQGRGSAANSAVCFALGITSVDPARSSMLFERFISRERAEPPDIDVDFEHERREEVLQYVYERYGRHRAALVNEVIAYRRRSAIRDVGKAFGLSLDRVDRLARCLDRWSAGQGVPVETLVREAGVDPSEPAVRNVLDLSEEIIGFPRHLSIHVGGFVISEEPLIDLVPIEPATMPGRTVIQWDKDDIDIVQFVKVDLLGLGMLTAIRKAFELVAAHSGRELTLASVPAEDPAVYAMFQRADTVGVFQIESRAQMSMLPRLRPRCFYDLVIEVAIVRPGPIQGGMVHPYLRRRNGEEPVTYAHPLLEPILERTLGVPLFQEQVMQMAIAVGGFSPGEADQLRRSMGAWRRRGQLDAIGRRLVNGMIERGITPEYAEAIFRQILGFGEYGFPESHAASFALLVYVSGWLKCHVPAAFAAALINSQPMGFYSPRAILADAQRHGVEVRPVSVASSVWDCTLEPGSSTHESAAIRLGFRLLSGFRAEDAERIVRARGTAPFRDLADFAGRTGLGAAALRTLADSGALEPLEAERRAAAWKIQGSWSQLPLFSAQSRREPEAPLPVATEVDHLHADYRTSGVSVDRHPVRCVRDQLNTRGVVSAGEVCRVADGQRIEVFGLVSCRQRPPTASGVVFMTLEDETGMVNLVIWPRVWAEYRLFARDATLLGASGRVQRDGDGDCVAVSVLVERFWGLENSLRLESASRDFH